MKKYRKNLLTVIALMLALSVVLPIAAFSASANEIMLGDVDGNNSLDSYDALLIQRYSVGMADFTESQKICGDLNSDGVVDALDALLVLRTSVGLEAVNKVSVDFEIVVAPNKTSEKSSKSYSDEVIRLINVERAKENLKPLTLDAKLCSVAETRAEETYKVFSHKRPDGSAWYTLLESNKISYHVSGENIAAGQQTPEEVVQAWLDSPGHRKNIMNPEFTKMGIGLYYVNGDMYTYYWEQVFVG